MSVLRISIKQASNVYEENCRTLEVLEIFQPGANAVELVTKWVCFMTAPFGFPVEPEVKNAYAGEWL
jgi:hypothetical protein